MAALRPTGARATNLLILRLDYQPAHVLEWPRRLHALLIHTRVFSLFALTFAQMDVPSLCDLVMNKSSE